MKVQNKVMIGIAAAGLMALVSMLPRSHERVHVLARDGAYEEALQGLLVMYEAGDRRPETLTQLYKLSLRTGDLDSASLYLSGYLAQRPNDADAWRFQAELQGVMHDPEGQRHSLEQSVRIAPNAERVRMLLEQYRIRGDFAAEKDMMRRSDAQGLLGFLDLERFGHLLASDGDLEGARAVLQRYDLRAPADMESGRLLLIDVLLDLKDDAAALRLAHNWIKASHQEWRAMNLLRRFTAKAPAETTGRLTRLILDLFPTATFNVVALLGELGERSAAQRLVARWLAAKPDRTEKELADYVWAMRMIGADQDPFILFKTWVAQNAPAARKVALVRAIHGGYGYNGLAPIRHLLTPDLLSLQPLFAAELMYQEGQWHNVFNYLTMVDVANLQRSEQERWITLLNASHNETAALQLLATLHRQHKLPPDLVVAYATMATAAGQPLLHGLHYARGTSTR
jgi:hypothetical protein